MKVTSIAAVTLLAASILSTSLTSSSADSAGATDASAQRHGSVPVDSPLRQLAKRQDLLIGTAVDMDALAADATYRDRIATEFSSVTAENVMKWGLLEPVRGQLDFTAADQLVATARRNGQQVRGHTLLWHNQLPTWLTDGVANGSIGPAELRTILRQHVFDVVSHFRGKLYQWDVVNEVIDDDAQLRDTIFLQQLGPGYIADMFRWARQADPRVKLYINDYNVEAGNPKSDAYFELVKDLLRQRVPIDGFGAQGHLGVQFGFNTASQVAANLKRFEDLGLETSLTEVDVRMLMPADTVKLQAQAQGYGVLLQGCLLARKCTSFTVWGYTDKYSWVPGFFEGEGAANLLDESFGPKPAYQELQAVLAIAGR